MTPIGYIRVSTVGQAADGSGLEVQAERIRAWCAYQGLGEPTIHSDVFTGSEMNRAGFRAAVRSALHAGSGASLVVYKLDRLGRNAIDIQETLAVLLEGGVRVVSLSEGVDSASGMGKAVLKLLVGILSTVAELERDAILTRLADGRAQAKRDGRAYTKSPPYGRHMVDGRMVDCPAEQTTLARIRAFHASGMGVRAIARRLTESGVLTRAGTAWNPATIRRLLLGRTEVKKPGSGKARLNRVRAWFEADTETPPG